LALYYYYYYDNKRTFDKWKIDNKDDFDFEKSSVGFSLILLLQKNWLILI